MTPRRETYWQVAYRGFITGNGSLHHRGKWTLPTLTSRLLPTLGNVHGQLGVSTDNSEVSTNGNVAWMRETINRRTTYFFRTTFVILFTLMNRRAIMWSVLPSRDTKLEEGETSWTMRLWQDCGPFIRV